LMAAWYCPQGLTSRVARTIILFLVGVKQMLVPVTGHRPGLGREGP